MAPPASLQTATAQELQLELLRRTRYNALDGERVYASLLRHRQLWLAALLDRPGVPNYAQPSKQLMAGLIKLRDLPENLWNADTLFILTESPQQTRALARIVEDEDWAGEVQVYEDPDEISRVLGTGREGYGLLSIWWD
jgi:hypothetical protein